MLTSVGLFSRRITLFVNRNVNSLVQIYVANGTTEKSRMIVVDWFLFCLGTTITITYVLTKIRTDCIQYNNAFTEKRKITECHFILSKCIS